MRFEPRWQYEVLAERREVLVDGEPRPVGGDLEQDSARLEE